MINILYLSHNIINIIIIELKFIEYDSSKRSKIAFVSDVEALFT